MNKLGPEQQMKVTERFEHLILSAIEIEGKVNKVNLECSDIVSIWLNLTASILDQCFEEEDCKPVLDHFMMQVQMIRKTRRMLEAGDMDGATAVAIESAKKMGIKNITVVHMEDD